MRYFKSMMLATAMMLATPAFLTSCQEDAPELDYTLSVNVSNDFSEVIEAINKNNSNSEDAISKLAAAIDRMNGSQATKLQTIIDALNTGNNTTQTKLAAIEAAMKAQTLSLGNKLDAIETAIKALPDYNSKFDAAIAALGTLKDAVELQTEYLGEGQDFIMGQQSIIITKLTEMNLEIRDINAELAAGNESQESALQQIMDKLKIMKYFVANGGAVATLSYKSDINELLTLYFIYEGVEPYYIEGATLKETKAESDLDPCLISYTYEVSGDEVKIYGDLNKLMITSPALNSIDVSHMTKLKQLFLDQTYSLTSLDVTNNLELEKLRVRGSSIKSINLENNKKLTDLNLEYTPISSINLAKNTQLRNLYLKGDGLSTIDLSKNTELRWIDLDENKLTSIDVSKNLELQALYLNHNLLEDLDVSNNTMLDQLGVGFNKLSTIDLSNVDSHFWTLNIIGNSFDEDLMTNIVNLLPERGHYPIPGMLYIQEAGEPITVGITKAHYDALIAKGWQCYDSHGHEVVIE